MNSTKTVKMNVMRARILSILLLISMPIMLIYFRSVGGTADNVLDDYVGLGFIAVIAALGFALRFTGVGRMAIGPSGLKTLDEGQREIAMKAFSISYSIVSALAIFMLAFSNLDRLHALFKQNSYQGEIAIIAFCLFFFILFLPSVIVSFLLPTQEIDPEE